jgi:hypothetical protein
VLVIIEQLIGVGSFAIKSSWPEGYLTQNLANATGWGPASCRAIRMGLENNYGTSLFKKLSNIITTSSSHAILYAHSQPVQSWDYRGPPLPHPSVSGEPRQAALPAG